MHDVQLYNTPKKRINVFTVKLTFNICVDIITLNRTIQEAKMRKLLSAEIAESISSLILEKYEQNSKIPTEPELAKMFSVSRTTIREAIKLLCSQGIIEIKRGSGTFVKHNTGLVCDPFGMKFMERGKLIKEMGEFSLICQPGFANFAAQRATADDIAALQENYRHFEEEWQAFNNNGKQFHLLRRLDVEFHALIRKACHNQIINRVDSIFLEFDSMDPIFIYAIEASIYWHPRIVEAIRNGDPAGSETAMRQHILDIEKNIASGKNLDMARNGKPSNS